MSLAPSTLSSELSSENNLDLGLPKDILLVEDDKAHAQLIGRAIKGLAVKIHHVESIEAAKNYLETEAIDLVLTDLNLVTTSGLELVRDLSTNMSELPVIVLTSSSNLDDAVKAMREGAWDYLTKQFTATFTRQLELVLRRAWTRAIEKRKEIEAAEERNAFWLATNLAEDGVAILSSRGDLLFNNPAFSDFTDSLKLGFDESIPEDASLTALIAQHDFQLSQAFFSQIVVGEDSVWSSELRLNNEEQRFYSLKLSTISKEAATEQGKTLRYHILWIKDLTNIKVSAERERNILATTTHDLKGPLGAILTSTELMLEETPDEMMEKMLFRVASCARTCVNLVDELLSARRLEDGMLDISKDWIDVLEIGHDVYEDFMPVSKAKGINFLFVKPEKEIKLFGDKLSIQRIISNLVGNALKFTPPNGEVVLELEGLKDGVDIKVSDTGAGIPLEKQAKLFDMFTRSKEHSKVEGTGLGLYITKELVDLHQGKIVLKSSPGQGTSFLVALRNPSMN